MMMQQLSLDFISRKFVWSSRSLMLNELLLRSSNTSVHLVSLLSICISLALAYAFFTPSVEPQAI